MSAHATTSIPRISTSVLTGLIIPAGLLIILAIVPPHAFDLSVSRMFFADGWPWHQDGTFTLFFYKLPKYVPYIAGGLMLAYLCTLIAQGRHILEEDTARRVLYTVVAMAACAAIVWWLKDTTGVACPWSVDAFGGSAPMTDPEFGLSSRPGRCWPSGHAGTGFVFIALYFALKDRRPRMAAATLLFAVAFGVMCGVIRVMEGAHFVSHVFVTAVIDWMICAAVYALMLEDWKAPAFSKPLSEKSLITLTALWWTFVFNTPFLIRAIGLSDPNFVWNDRLLVTLAFFAAVIFLISTAILALASALPRPVRRVVYLLLNVSGACVFAGILFYGITFNPDMARNIIATDAHEASTYLSARTIALAIAAGLPPILAAAASEMAPAGLKRSALRTGGALAAVAAALACIALNFSAFSSTMRNDHSLRYLITPVNVPYSLAATLIKDSSPDQVVKTVVDPKPALTVALKRPAVLLVVVGETTRAQNWGLNGYRRDTTPELRAENVISHGSVVSCGTSTDVSLPCMMSRIGRSNYDRARILQEEALPSLLARAGARVVWVDNQSGCKGTCANTLVRKPAPKNPECASGQCFDGVLVDELKTDLADLPADRPTVLFYHMYGEHGPRYFEDSPKSAKVWLPECTDADLSACSNESIVNAYDNAVRYTDSVLAGLVRELKARTDIDAGFVYVSDHGESLGENGVYLHGAPYFMSPDVQNHVPMVMWFSPEWGRTFGFDTANLAREPEGGITHDNLYSTVLGILGVKSTTYSAKWDLTGRGDLASK